MILSNKAYDILKWIAMILLPALATLIVAVFNIWQIPYGEPIAATIMAIDTFLGAILQISNGNYKKNLKENIDVEVDELTE